jgi:tetrapyrrole methylase family protein/MazG family protein
MTRKTPHNLPQDSTENQGSQHSERSINELNMRKVESTTSQSFEKLLKIVFQLRAPGGCPWDREQTQRSLTQYAIEEAYELAEAIESGTQAEIQEELGDFLFQVVLQAQVAEDEGHFNIQDVLETLNRKMIHRHPHVFGDAGERSIDEVWKHWDKLKAAEQLNKSTKPKPVFSYPRQMPALQAAYKIGVKTEGYKFDWKTPDQVFEKVTEEFHELKEALESQDREQLEHELGDLLFSAAQLARHLKMEPEQILRKANRRFEARFNQVLKLSGLSKDEFRELSEEKMQELWAQAKKWEAANG